MEKNTSCEICNNITKLYYCNCGKFFCKYHSNIIIHGCPIKHPLSNYVCYYYLTPHLKERFISST